MRRLLLVVIVFIPSVSCWGVTKITATSGTQVAVSIASTSSVASAIAPDFARLAPTNSSVTSNQVLSTMECFQVANATSASTVVCAMKLPATYWIGNIVAVIALVISFGGLLYTLRKDKKARIQSIEDDYWIRKVISPIALEPLIKKIAETVSAIPDDRWSENFNDKECGEFGKKFQSEWAQLACSMDALALLSKDVCKTAMTHVAIIEDEVLRYCSNNLTGKVGPDGGCKYKTELQEKMNAEMIAIMNCIKQFQVSKI